MKTVGLIAYDYPHLKTEQTIYDLYGRYELKVYGLPFIPREARRVLFQHRPDQSIAAHPAEICANLNIPYYAVEADTQIEDTCDIYLVTAGKILSVECLQNKKVLNCHPGVIPAARGLDAFKWSILHDLPLGVTLHYIDAEVDMGEVISITPTPVYASDTLQSLARRHYENELRIFKNFEQYLQHPQNPFAGLSQRESLRRMPANIEQQMIDHFDAYKQRFCCAYLEKDRYR